MTWIGALGVNTFDDEIEDAEAQVKNDILPKS